MLEIPTSTPERNVASTSSSSSSFPFFPSFTSPPLRLTLRYLSSYLITVSVTISIFFFRESIIVRGTSSSERINGAYLTRGSSISMFLRVRLHTVRRILFLPSFLPCAPTRTSHCRLARVLSLSPPAPSLSISLQPSKSFVCIFCIETGALR